MRLPKYAGGPHISETESAVMDVANGSIGSVGGSDGRQ